MRLMRLATPGGVRASATSATPRGRLPVHRSSTAREICSRRNCRRSMGAFQAIYEASRFGYPLPGRKPPKPLPHQLTASPCRLPRLSALIVLSIRCQTHELDTAQAWFGPPKRECVEWATERQRVPRPAVRLSGGHRAASSASSPDFGSELPPSSRVVTMPAEKRHARSNFDRRRRRLPRNVAS
jgi:hypothetical protein